MYMLQYKHTDLLYFRSSFHFILMRFRYVCDDNMIIYIYIYIYIYKPTSSVSIFEYPFDRVNNISKKGSQHARFTAEKDDKGVITLREKTGMSFKTNTF